MIRSKIAVVAVFAVLLMAGMTVQAQEGPMWTYIDLGYLDVDVDNLQDSGGNWFLGGTVGFAEMWHARLVYTDGELSSNFDQTTWELAGGWHGGLGEKADLVGELLWLDSEIKNTGGMGGKISDDGWGATIGARWRLVPLFEVDGFINYSDYSDAGDQVGYELRALVYIKKLVIGAGYEWIDADNTDASQYNVFVRWNFK